jgi:hypothetical protein
VEIGDSQPSEQHGGGDANKMRDVHRQGNGLGTRGILLQNQAKLPMKIGNPDNKPI